MKEVAILLLLFCVNCFGASSGGIEGTFFYLCSTTNTTTVTAADVHSGTEVGAPVSFNIPGVLSNIMSTATDSSINTLYVGLNDGTNGYVKVFNYTATSFNLYKTCTFPGAGNSSSIYCVATTKGATYVAYGSGLGGQSIGQLDVATCTITFLAQSPVSVKGSVSGPGGQCVAVSNQSSIYYVDDASATLYQYNYNTNQFSNYTMPSDFYTESFFYLFGSNNLNFLIFYDYAPTTYQIPFATMTAQSVNTQSIQEMGVIDTVNPPNLVDFSYGGISTTLYSLSGNMLAIGPTITTENCTGGFNWAYDCHTSQYGYSSHNDASSLSFSASILFSAVIALMWNN